jgi:hypothetical protein
LINVNGERGHTSPVKDLLGAGAAATPAIAIARRVKLERNFIFNVDSWKGSG